jgi:hypothetical protein
VARPDARLILAGAAVGAVADDPLGEAGARRGPRLGARFRPAGAPAFDLATLPMTHLDENAVIVNALQRQAAVVVKKSLQEGLGLGVTEALWKARPVVASGVGGHRDQIEHRRTGLLVDDPSDLATFGAAVSELLGDPAEALELAAAGREQVRARFLRTITSWAGRASSAPWWPNEASHAEVCARRGAHRGAAASSPPPARRSRPQPYDVSLGGACSPPPSPLGLADAPSVDAGPVGIDGVSEGGAASVCELALRRPKRRLRNSLRLPAITHLLGSMNRL